MLEKGTLRLESDRLILRRAKIDDVDQIFENWANDPLATEFLIWSPHGMKTVTQSVVEEWISHYDERDFYLWVIAFEEQVIGSIEARSSIGNKEIGYCIGSKWWGKGIAPEAVALVFDYLFLEMGFHRLFAKHNVNNPASGRVMEKCGMTKEGILREDDYHEGRGYEDSALYGVLKREWEAHRSSIVQWGKK